MSYEIVDRESGNAIAFFESESEAIACLETLVRQDPADRDVLALIQFDDQGHPLKSWSAGQLVGTV